MVRAACKTELYQHRRSAGLCVQCGVDAGGKSRCASCAEKDKTARQRRREKRKAAGVCSECNRTAKAGRALCQGCIDKRSKVSMDRYHRNKAAGVCPYCGGDTNGEFMCKECQTAHKRGSRAWYDRQVAAGFCVSCGKSHNQEGGRCAPCREKARLAEKQRYHQARAEAFDAYGGPTCVRCGETDLDVLQIDHINGGGTQHRKEIGEPICYWLRKQGFPPGYQVLCANCNTKKGCKASPVACLA